MIDKFFLEVFVNGLYDFIDLVYDDFDFWYCFSLLIQVVFEGQIYILIVFDFYFFLDKDIVDNFYNYVVRNVYGEIQERKFGFDQILVNNVSR